MGPDDATDVAKALAAFGAPSIRYHSFGQGQVKPSSVVLPRLGLPPLEAADAVPAPRPAMPVDPVLSMLPMAPRQAEPVPRPVATPPKAAPLTPPWPITPPLATFPLALPPLDMSPLVAPMPPMPAFGRTADPAASPRAILSRAVPAHPPFRLDLADKPSAPITMTLRALLETDQGVTEGLPFSNGQTPPAAFAAMRLHAKSPPAPPISAPSSAPPISVQVSAAPKPAVMPALGRSAPAGRPGQSLAAIFAFLASNPAPGENSSPS